MSKNPKGTLNDKTNAHWLDDGCTVKAKENRPKPGAKEPHSPLANRSLSEPAKLLKAAREGDRNALTILIGKLRLEIKRHARVNQWNLKEEKFLHFATVILFKYVYGEKITHRRAADLMQIGKTTYQRNWLPKISEIERWVKGWSEELL